MPIHDQSYRHWEGTFKSHAFRWWVITREGLRIILRRKMFLLFILAPPAIVFLVHGIIIYVVNIYEDIFKMNIDGSFFFGFFMRQTFWIVLICVFGGSGLIANDLKNNALQLYLSKPLTRRDYLVGKLATVMILMGFVTVAPGIVLFLENALVSEGTTFLTEKYWMFGSIILYSLFLTLPTGLLILALSSMTKSSRYAAISFAAILTGTPLFSELLRGVLKLKPAIFASYWSNLYILGRQLFGMSSPDRWYWATLILVGIMGICIWIMHRKVKGVEIVK